MSKTLQQKQHPSQVIGFFVLDLDCQWNNPNHKHSSVLSLEPTNNGYKVNVIEGIGRVQMAAQTEKLAQKEAKNLGWVFQNGHATCPLCAKHLGLR